MTQTSCFGCRFFSITYDRTRPYGCRAFGFRSQRLPSIDVYMSSGKQCAKRKPTQSVMRSAES